MGTRHQAAPPARAWGRWAGADPLNVAVLLEDGVAVLGVGVAAGCIGLTALTHNPMYDALGSILVGTMLGPPPPPPPC